jgi:hypothetical protein
MHSALRQLMPGIRSTAYVLDYICARQHEESEFKLSVFFLKICISLDLVAFLFQWHQAVNMLIIKRFSQKFQLKN